VSGVRLVSRASAAIDRGVVRFMERKMAPSTPRVHGDPRAQLIELAGAYGAGMDTFFAAPEAIAPRLAPQGDGPLGTRIIDLSWDSPFVPFLPAARELYLAHRENSTAHARYWTSGPGRPTIVLLHGWGGGTHWLTARAFDVAYWLKHGYDVVAFVLPFHGARAPGGKSGALFPSANPLRTNEAFGQAIYDLRALSAWLRTRGATAVGAMGMSLGGYTTALWATIEELDFAVAMIPAVSMAALMWRHGEHSPARKHAVKAGVSEDLLVDAFAVHAPTTRAPLVARDRLFVVAGRGDRITPPDQAEALAKHWGTDILWFDGGHLAQVGRGDSMRLVRQRLGALDLPGRVYRS
jgi:dienelactone hydrolase